MKRYSVHVLHGLRFSKLLEINVRTRQNYYAVRTFPNSLKISLLLLGFYSFRNQSFILTLVAAVPQDCSCLNIKFVLKYSFN
jgi:hypothetical protein